MPRGGYCGFPMSESVFIDPADPKELDAQFLRRKAYAV
jgi:hypothetical protein